MFTVWVQTIRLMLMLITHAGFLDLNLPLLQSLSKLLLFLLLPTLVEVLDDHAHKHVEDEETDDEQERDEVEDQPLVVVLDWLQVGGLRL